MNQNTEITEIQQPQKPKFSVAINTPTFQKLIANTLNDPARVRTFTASVVSAVGVTPALQECQASSIITCALLGESLNLQPSPQLGQYYFVPFKKKRKTDDGKYVEESIATFILGYKGYIQLAIRSGIYADIDAVEIHEGEYKGRDKFTGKPMFEFIEDDIEREHSPVVGYMAYFEYLNGFKKVLYWSKEKMIAHADQYSPAFNRTAYEKILKNEIPETEMWKYSSFWYKNFDEMAKKTMLRQLISKWGVMSIEMQTAFNADNHEIKQENNIFTPVEDSGDSVNQYIVSQKEEIKNKIDEPQKVDLNSL